MARDSHWKLTCPAVEGEWAFVLEEMSMDGLRAIDVRKIEDNIVVFSAPWKYQDLLNILDRCLYGSDFDLEETDL